MAKDQDTPQPSKAEVERNKEREAQANESNDERSKRLEKERAQQQKAAGQDPKDDPKPLSQTDNAGGLVKTTIGGKEMELTESEATQLRATPVRGTAVDGMGTERVVLPATDPWEPAQVEPDPVEVARLERVSKALEAKQAERLAALTGGQL